MDIIGGIFEVLGDALNGVLQVITDFINLLIEIVPNPDPFRDMVDTLPDSAAVDMGLVWYWIDAFIGVDVATGIIMAWAGLMIASAVFAVIYWVIKSIKP